MDSTIHDQAIAIVAERERKTDHLVRRAQDVECAADQAAQIRSVLATAVYDVTRLVRLLHDDFEGDGAQQVTRILHQVQQSHDEVARLAQAARQTAVRVNAHLATSPSEVADPPLSPFGYWSAARGDDDIPF